ncbi:MAG: hypothetical protein ACUVQ1_07590 [Candidatus Kapaibacteriales bacterium]
MKSFIFWLLVLTFIVGCSSTRQTKDNFIGYSSFPEREKQEKVNTTNTVKKQDHPTITSSQPLTEEVYNGKGKNVIINNYYGPYHPNYYPYDPFVTDFWIYYYDPFFFTNDRLTIVYSPYYGKHFIYYPYPYDPYYWDYWMRRRGIVYVPAKTEPERPKTIRDFGPSRGNPDNDKYYTPTSQSRSSSRSAGKTTTTIIDKDEPTFHSPANEAIRAKAPEKFADPNNKNSKEAPKTNTKNKRSSTRPK